jgi:hypothetical protein
MTARICTRRGVLIDLFDPPPSAFDIGTVAHALAQKCRWGGQAARFYSIAQHCVLTSWLVPDEVALQGLLHELDEVFLPDVPGPLKHLPWAAEWRALCDRHMRAGCAWHGLPYPFDERVHLADELLLSTEARDIMSIADPVAEWGVRWAPLPCRIEPWDMLYSEAKFLSRYADLKAGKK